MQKPFTQLGQRHNIIRQFTPNWFTVSMGTGVVALIVSEFPMLKALTWQLGTGLWYFNILLFVLFTVLYGLRWAFYPHEAKQIFQHPSMSLFLGTIPMALATILNGFLKYGQPIYGDTAVQIAQTLWYADVVLALLVAWAVPFAMYRHQEHALQQMTAVWLLPIVACEVAASSGGLLLGHLAADTHAVAILLGSYVLWGVSVLPAFAILTILMLRLVLHKLPEKELAVSSWLALGPIGTAALALLVLGHQAPMLMASLGLAQLGQLFQQAGILASLILLGFGLWWLGIAVLTTLHHAKQDLPFNLGWWGLTFPLGVYTLAILTLAQQLNLAFLYAVGYAFAAILMLLWSLVATKTAQGFYQGHLFFSPCLKTYLEQQYK
ncbi:TDT family transporter [Acinetobacter johnsonii]|uniref:TDT family transporter n=1 Tax=Acinetobacter johnsonii TaxID=40214 RepID=A0AA42LA67_ACIJO|nr:TDT family transporter [Acinetobacter johnsonii]MDA0776252.1 TDT family transporter [Pseudomonadota bacterium]MDA1170792.1 TDT family transporter [Pseudomonadota bacterium]MDH0655886.1 TDT family transporter [Acinetobacter johnsonii]MDH2171721.1 TDT family transporter [Acinetobacter johnsonii]MDH2175272.1 TDT family transporter [Acinetobacter johnsonii]